MAVDPSGLWLRLHPDRVLRERAEPIGTVDETVRELVASMLEIMREADGIGLAAPQVGVSKRVFVCDVPGATGEQAESEPRTVTDGPLVCIDPVIEDPSDERSPFDEGCLSLPGIRGDVIRPEVVRLSALGLDGARFTVVCGGLLARCVQHELDHLDGVLILDRMTQMSRLKNRRRIRELEAGA
ncbi:MAG: peptide deformylase [Planctomycetota bacterium]